MSRRPNERLTIRPGLPAILLVAVLISLWVAGGSSRADALGQAVVRGAALAALTIGILAGMRPDLMRHRSLLVLLLAMIGLVLVQLVPLPPEMWLSLPGRDAMAAAASASGQTQSWRPVAIVPDAALNAVFSLIVPLALLFLASALNEREKAWMPGLVLALVSGSMVLGLLQFSGAGFNNPFINDAPSEVSGIFANRNHFSLFLSMGCLLAPVWAFWNGRRPGWRVTVALGLILLFILTILASGSRAGILLGLLAFVLGLGLARHGIRRELRGAPAWVFGAIIAGILATVSLVVLLSVISDRAVSVNRALSLSGEDDLRSIGLPVVWSMMGEYFPFGSGFGGFDAVFRIGEPAHLLSPSYFNHAHNDFLEVVLDGGVAGGLLLLAAIGWWLFATVRAWRLGSGPALLGSAILLLVFLASLVDYPARTPMIMAMVVLAAMWLSAGEKRPARPALPAGDQHL